MNTVQVLDLQEQDFSLLGKGAKLHGTFQMNGPTRLSGQLHGELFMLGKFDLVIEVDGFLEGTVNCAKLEIYGQFKGHLQSSSTVTIYPSATVSGNISAQDLIIHPGAKVNIEGKTNK